MKKYKTVSVENTPALLEQDGTLLLDCRQVADYKAGHIDNALHAHDALVESLIRKGNKSQQIVIYCYTGHSSQHLAEFFGGFGFTDVYSVDGGFEKWQAVQASAQ